MDGTRRVGHPSVLGLREVMGIRILVVADERPIADFLVRGRRGSLQVRNRLGHGSCFTLRFPTLLTAPLLIAENS